ncbi:hypothetical protein LCGC14_1884790, partial [marine sediment metagenome]
EPVEIGVSGKLPSDPVVVVASRSHGSEATEKFLERFTVRERTSAGSSLKICLVAEAIKRVFDKNGNRKDKRKARLRYLVRKIGFEGFRELYARELAALKADSPACPSPRPIIPPVPTGEGAADGPPPESADFPQWRQTNVTGQKQPGQCIVEVPLLLGDIRADKLRSMADIAGRFGEQMVRTTQWQSLVLRWVFQGELADLHQALAAVGLADSQPTILRKLIACTGAGTEEESPTPAFVPSPSTPPSDTSPPPTPTPAPTQVESPDNEDSLGLLTIVDKEHGLPPAYAPPNLVEIPPEWIAPGFPSELLRKEASEALVVMLRAARAEGHELRLRSAYRSYEEQATTFQYWIDQLGEEEARRVSAPPGHSEHQLGTTVDLTSASVGWQLEQAFGQTPEGQWLAAHAHEYGFPLSYPQGAEAITGYTYEPWHFRYIGRDQAANWAQSGLTLIEFLKQPTD